MPYAYRKSERLRKNAEFVATMKAKRLSVDGLSLFYRKNGSDDFRIGISVSKKLAKAAKRNRLRRQIRNCITRVIGDVAAGYDLVFMARQGLMDREFDQILKAVTQVLQRSAIIGPKAEGGQQ
jgi:ribonuclease P protein component